MVWRLGLVLACLLGCGDNETPPPVDLIGDLWVEQVAEVPADRVLAVAIAPDGARGLVIARATTQGADFCADCLDPDSTDCGATCRRAVLDVTHQPGGDAAALSHRFLQVFPETRDHDVTALDLVAIGEAQVGLAWLECDRAPCGAAQPKQRCTARYTIVDLLTGRPGAARTLYQGWYGDLQLAFDLRTERLLAVVGTQGASGTGVHAAIFDASGTTPIAPWRSYGGPGARAPAATASADGFLIVADAPAPDEPGPMEPCVEACDCPEPGTSALATGGLYAFSPGTGRAADRISPGRSPDGVYSPREAIAAIDAGGRVIVAGSHASGSTAELFEPVVGGWLRRHTSRAPTPLWLGALGDASRLGWIGSEPVAGSPAKQRLVAGLVLIGQLEQRGELAELDRGAVIQVAPVRAAGPVRPPFRLRAVRAADGTTPQRSAVLAGRPEWGRRAGAARPGAGCGMTSR
jgi:hypothetical protein